MPDPNDMNDQPPLPPSILDRVLGRPDPLPDPEAREAEAREAMEARVTAEPEPQKGPMPQRPSEPDNPSRPGWNHPTPPLSGKPDPADGHWSALGARAAYQDILDVIAQPASTRTVLDNVIARCQLGVEIGVPEIADPDAEDDSEPVS